MPNTFSIVLLKIFTSTSYYFKLVFLYLFLFIAFPKLIFKGINDR